MNLVGKIFTVLIFLMCVVFGSFALMVHAAHKNWRAEAIELNKLLTEANKNKGDLLQEKKDLQTALDDEKARTRARLIALEAATVKAVGDKTEMEKSIQEKEGRIRVLALAINAAQQELKTKETENESMRSDIKTVVEQRNTTMGRLQETTDKVMTAVAERERVEKLGKELAGQLAKLNEFLQYAKLAPQAFKEKNPPPDLEGTVLAIPHPNFVEISVGADDGVRKGHRFTVTRGNKYVGEIVVTEVNYPNRAVCRPDTSMQSDQIQKDDHVKAKAASR
jgi:hypothetical protein